MPGNQSLWVVKLGGSEGVDFSAICGEVAALHVQGQALVLVHGGSAEANFLGESLGTPPRFITSPSGYTSRYTDRRTLEIFSMAVNGKVNTLLVEQLQSAGVNAIGLSGVDGRLISAERKEAIVSVEAGKRKIIRDDFSGKISAINTALLGTLLQGGYLPVVAPLAISPQGQALNVDADRVAAMIAAAMFAQKLILLTAAPGLLRKFPDESSLISTLAAGQLETALEYAQGRMKKKVLAAGEALAGGVKQVVIADGRRERPIQHGLSGGGTHIGQAEAL